jgi:hypothetical protein
VPPLLAGKGFRFDVEDLIQVGSHKSLKSRHRQRFGIEVALEFLAFFRPQEAGLI